MAGNTQNDISSLNRRVSRLEASIPEIYVTEPTSPKVNAIWIDFVTKAIKIWDGKKWV